MMTPDLKRELLRHLTAALVFRAKIAILDAPDDFAAFRIDENIRTPAELLAHLGDLLEGSLHLMKGNLVYLNSAPLAWKQEITRFVSAAKEFDAYLASDAPLGQPVEKIMQGPVADALTHVGQIVMLRRAAKSPVRVEGYFTAEIVAGEINESF
ncbi:MAG TPA: hypothetical protein VF721_23450 [Pyrinomonadaceae bacterium]|jgi:hypothetical protein